MTPLARAPLPTAPSIPTDGDGSNVNSMNHWVEIEAYASVTTYYVGNYYEKTGTTMTTYYYAGGQRVAMREGTSLYYLLGDHLGSTSITAEPDGDKAAEIRYKPFGEQRYHEDLVDPTPTMRRFTGQKLTGTGLYFYNSRWLDPALGRFIQPDTIIPDPGSPQDYDRYAYVRNAPTMHTDPSGHRPCDQEINGECISESSWYVKHHTRVNRNALSTEPGEVTGISGVDFYNWYLDLYYSPQSSWWWQMFGMDDDGFSVFDAMAVVMTAEASGQWSNPDLPEAAIRAANYWFGNDTLGVEQMTTEDYINWFAEYSSSAGTYVSNNFTPANPFTNPYLFTPFTSADVAALNTLSSSFQNHPDSWNRGCIDYDRPCGWGNMSLYSREVQDLITAHKNATFAFTGGDSWIIPSGCIMIYYINGKNLSENC